MATRVPLFSSYQAPGKVPAPSAMASPILPGGTPTPGAVTRVPVTAMSVQPQQIAQRTGDTIQTAGAVPRTAPAPVPAPTPAPVPPPAPTPPPAPYKTDFGGGDPAQQQRQISDAMNAGTPIPGFDMGKFADPNHQTTKYIAGRIIGASGSVNDVLAQPQFAGWKPVAGSSDKILSPDGNIYDLIYDEEGVHRPQFTLVGGPKWDAQNSGNARSSGGGKNGGGKNAGGGNTGTGTNTNTDADLLQFIDELFGPGGVYGTPTGVPPSSAPLPGSYTQPGNIGTDPFSQLIDDSLGGLIGASGSTPYGESIAATVADLISRGGLTPAVEEQLYGAREDAARAQQSLLEDSRAALAESGGLSTPGVAQGPTSGNIYRIQERIAPEFAGAVRDIGTHAVDVANQSMIDTLSLATGLSRDQSNSLISALGSGTTRQQMLSTIALQQLAQDQDWSRFLAEHGLDVAKVEEEIRMGRITALIPLLQLFIQGGAVAAGGFF